MRVPGPVARMLLALGTACGAVASCGESSHPPALGSYGNLTGDAGSEGGVPSLGIPIDPGDDPQTCTAAAASRSYVGCDYWPTVTANDVWSIFDFTVVVANAGATAADVTVTGPGSVDQSVTVAPNDIAKIYLPWVPSLKGTDADECGTSLPLTASVLAPASAYHLVSTVPVTVFQFNALEYAGQGGPQGKDWSSCPGNTACSDSSSPNYGGALGCYSFTNDSSLLFPTTALTGNYRVASFPGESAGTTPYMAGYVAITATTDGTHVKVFPSSTADVLPGTGVTGTTAGGELDLTMNAGDVAELPTTLGASFDLGGTLVQADQPVQVIAGAPCDQIPSTAPACDHLEQSVFPAETLGKQYFVTMPSGPAGAPVGHVVRLFGNVDGTTLAYAPSMPAGCPAALDAGQVGDCGVVAEDFEVTGSHEFAVATFMQGGSVVDPTGGLGDPSQSLVASVEQYRTKYVFLAPDDYEASYADIVVPSGVEMELDGKKVDYGEVSAIADGWGVWRVYLDGASNAGVHLLEASAPVGLQVMGYGSFTSYQYPGGLNLKTIAPPPGPNQ